MTGFPVISGYSIERELGQGGMARVYLAHEAKLERQVALKTLLPSFCEIPHAVERFMKEAKTAARLVHSNIVTVYDVGSSGDIHYIAVEYLPGGSLKERISQGPLEPREALGITRQVAAALQYAHGKGFIHRDIKPDNIMFRQDGTAVLTDFGIAKAVDSATKLTKTGMSIGTPHYMSPEQARGKNVDGRSDLYALGIVLYETLTGKVPYDAEDSVAVAIQHIQEPLPVLPQPLSAIQPLLEKLLAKDPGHRLQSAGEVLAAIDALSSTAGSDGLLHDAAAKTAPAAHHDHRKNTPPPPAAAIAPLPSFLAAAEKKSHPVVFWLVGLLAVLVGVTVVLFVIQAGKSADQASLVAQDPQTVQPGGSGTNPAEPDPGSQTPDPKTGSGASGKVENLPEKAPLPPAPTHWLTDLAGVLDERIRSELDSKLEAFEKSSGIQFIVYIDKSSGSESIDEWAMRAFNSWGIGRRGADNGLALFIMTADHTMRISVGYGLEGKVSNAECSRILNEITTPRLRVDDVGGAVRDTIDAIMVPLAGPPGATGGPAEVALQPGGGFEVKGVRFEMVVIPGRNYAIEKTEVTQGQWQAVMGYNPSDFKKGDNYPVEQVSRDDCQTFIQKLNQQTGGSFRLPTEAEWEYAARGGTSGDRYGNIDAIAWYDDNPNGSTHPVGQKQPNGFGLYDTLGNVWEWCQGPEGVFRGGCWSNYAQHVTAAFRVPVPPSYRGNGHGFRLACDK